MLASVDIRRDAKVLDELDVFHRLAEGNLV